MSGYVLNSLDEAEEMIEGYLEAIEDMDFSMVGEYDSESVRIKAQLDFAQLIFGLYGNANGESVNYVLLKLMRIFKIDVTDNEIIKSLLNEEYFENLPFTLGIVYRKFLKISTKENQVLLKATLKMYELLCGLMSIGNEDETLTNFINRYTEILNDTIQTVIDGTDLIDSEDDDYEDDEENDDDEENEENEEDEEEDEEENNGVVDLFASIEQILELAEVVNTEDIIYEYKMDILKGIKYIVGENMTKPELAYAAKVVNDVIDEKEIAEIINENIIVPEIISITRRKDMDLEIRNMMEKLVGFNYLDCLANFIDSTYITKGRIIRLNELILKLINELNDNKNKKILMEELDRYDLSDDYLPIEVQKKELFFNYCYHDQTNDISKVVINEIGLKAHEYYADIYVIATLILKKIDRNFDKNIFENFYTKYNCDLLKLNNINIDDFSKSVSTSDLNIVQKIRIFEDEDKKMMLTSLLSHMFISIEYLTYKYLFSKKYNFVSKSRSIFPIMMEYLEFLLQEDKDGGLDFFSDFLNLQDEIDLFGKDLLAECFIRDIFMDDISDSKRQLELVFGSLSKDSSNENIEDTDSVSFMTEFLIDDDIISSNNNKINNLIEQPVDNKNYDLRISAITDKIKLKIHTDSTALDWNAHYFLKGFPAIMIMSDIKLNNKDLLFVEQFGWNEDDILDLVDDREYMLSDVPSPIKKIIWCYLINKDESLLKLIIEYLELYQTIGNEVIKYLTSENPSRIKVVTEYLNNINEFVEDALYGCNRVERAYMDFLNSWFYQFYTSKNVYCISEDSLKLNNVNVNVYESESEEDDENYYDNDDDSFVRGIGKIIGTKSSPSVGYLAPASGEGSALTQRGNMALEDGDFSGAEGYFERALDANPSDARAYLGKFLVFHQLSSLADLENKVVFLDEEKEFKRAEQFADAKLASELKNVRDFNELKIERLRLLDVLKKHRKKFGIMHYEEMKKTAYEQLMLQTHEGEEKARNIFSEMLIAGVVSEGTYKLSLMESIYIIPKIAQFLSDCELHLKLNVITLDALQKYTATRVNTILRELITYNLIEGHGLDCCLIGAQEKKVLILKEAEERKQKEARQKAAFDEACAKVNKQIQDENSDLIAKSTESFDYELRGIEREINEAASEAERCRDSIKREIADLRSRQSALVFFKGKEKKALQVEIDAAQAKLNGIQTRQQLQSQYQSRIDQINANKKIESDRISSETRAKYTMPKIEDFAEA